MGRDLSGGNPCQGDLHSFPKNGGHTEMEAGYGIRRPDKSGFKATCLLLYREEEIFCGFSEDLLLICIGEEIESIPD